MRGPRAARWATGAFLGGGLALVGLGGYVYIAAVGRVFGGPEGSGTVSALTAVYLLVNIIGPGCFTALEQETSRAVSAALVAGGSVRGASRQALKLAAIASVVLVAVVELAWELALAPVLGGRIGMLFALFVAVVGSAAAYGVRGVLGGRRQFRSYALTFSVEGGVRLLGVIALALAGSKDPVAYALVFAVAPLAAAVTVGAGLRFAEESGVGAPAAQRMGRSFGLLVGATVASQTIANLAPVVVTSRLPDDALTSSVFGSAFVLARIPLFLFTPVLAVLLPTLTRHAEAGRHREFRRFLGRTVGVLAAVGVVGVGLTALVGPWAVQLLFNSAARPDVLTLTLLTTATVVTMLALVLQPALVALRRQHAVTLGWLVGGTAFVAILAGPLRAVPSAVAAQLAGPAIAAAVLGVLLARAGSPAADRPGLDEKTDAGG